MTALHGAVFHSFNRVSGPEAAQVLIAHDAALDVAFPDVGEILREAGAEEQLIIDV